MTRIFIDSNIVLDLYRTATISLDDFANLVGNGDLLVVPDHMITEFEKNQVVELDRFITGFRNPEQSAKINALVEALPGYASFGAAVKALQKERNAVLEQLIQAREFSKDPVASKILGLFRQPGVRKIPLVPEFVDKARERKALGYPPSSKDKITVGDEVIWESLLAGTKANLVIVSGDGTFETHEHVLKEEYRRKTKNELLLVTKKLTEAFARAGQSVPKSVVEAEERERSRNACYQCGEEMRPTAISTPGGSLGGIYACPRCGLMRAGGY